ncbi:MAG TPA: aldo/keto reductase [Cyclobacteriaceae bacterium]|nr:aldo/keto reductase [Cyclobacteriaceae bacterium]
MAIKTHPEGPSFSRLITGAWRWDEVSSDTVEKLINTSLEIGNSTFDHADIYGDHSNEEIFGNVLRKNPSLRNKMELVTKCGILFSSSKRPATRVKHYNTSKAHILWSVENSLKMLSTDRIELLLIHRPDPLLDPQEVAEAFTQLKKSGKVLFFGVSNFTPYQFDMLQSYLPFPLVTNQIELSLFYNQPLFDGSMDNLMRHKARAMAWSPLGGGKFLGKDDPAGKRVTEGLKKLGQKYSATESQLLLAWLLKHPALIFPIIGTTKPERIAESAKALNIELDRQDWFEMLQWVTGKEVA